MVMRRTCETCFYNTRGCVLHKNNTHPRCWRSQKFGAPKVLHMFPVQNLQELVKKPNQETPKK